MSIVFSSAKAGDCCAHLNAHSLRQTSAREWRIENSNKQAAKSKEAHSQNRQLALFGSVFLRRLNMLIMRQWSRVVTWHLAAHCCSLLAAFCSLLAACCLLLSALCSPLATCHLPLGNLRQLSLELHSRRTQYSNSSAAPSCRNERPNQLPSLRDQES